MKRQIYNTAPNRALELNSDVFVGKHCPDVRFT
jgi:hypothetical protein